MDGGIVIELTKEILLGTIAIICLTLLESVNLLTGHNGTIFTIVVAVIAGIAGFVIPSPLQKAK